MTTVSTFIHDVTKIFVEPTSHQNNPKNPQSPVQTLRILIVTDDTTLCVDLFSDHVMVPNLLTHSRESLGTWPPADSTPVPSHRM
jgi:hypothetical protein